MFCLYSYSQAIAKHWLHENKQKDLDEISDDFECVANASNKACYFSDLCHISYWNISIAFPHECVHNSTLLDSSRMCIPVPFSKASMCLNISIWRSAAPSHVYCYTICLTSSALNSLHISHALPLINSSLKLKLSNFSLLVL